MGSVSSSSNAVERQAVPRLRGLGAAIWSQLFLRVAQSAGVLIIGLYFADLQTQGLRITPLEVGLVPALVYVTELLLAPAAGSLSDARGRKTLLLAGPLLSAVAIALPPLGSFAFVLPPLGVVLGLLGASRLIEGLGSATSVPATLGFLSEGTDGNPLRRGRQMGFYELASSGGIAIGSVVGPLLWVSLRLYAFFGLAVIYLIAAGVTLLVREERRVKAEGGNLFNLRRYLALFANRRVAFFVPAWIAVNAILGVWVQSQIAFVLTGATRVPGQRFVGSLHNHDAELSALLGLYVLWFSLCVVIWAFILGRLPKLPTLLVTLCGSIVASVGLIAMNHGGPPPVFVPVVMLGVLLEAGFTPAALAYLADVSETFAQDRGLLMGLYSVILGAGYFLGNFLGAFFAQVAYFDGLGVLTILLVALGLLSVGALMVVERRAA